MLSGLEIKKQIKEGNIIISDFDDKRLNPNSYNIRLGNILKVYKKSTASSDELKTEIFKRMEPYHQEVQQITLDMQGENALDEKASEDRKKRIDELTKIQEQISNEVLRDYSLDPKKENETVDIIIPEEGYILMPGTLYLGETVEYTETNGFVPKIDGRSTTGRLGIVVHLTAGFGDNGFKGKWTLEITVTHPVIVYPNMEIGQLYFEELQGDTSMKYNGKYQNQQGVQAAKIDQVL